MNTLISGMMLVTACAILPAQQPVGSTESVRPGIEVFLSAVPARIRGKRVGLITNHAGIDRAGTSDIDLIVAHPDLKLVALFAAEHGIRGVTAAGEKVADDRDADIRPADFLAVQGGGSRPDARDAQRDRCARLRPPGSRRADVDLRLDDGALHAGGGPKEHPVRRSSTGPIRLAGRSWRARCSIRHSSRSSGCIPSRLVTA